MRQWMILNRLTGPGEDRWLGALLGENGIRAVDTFWSQTQIRGASTLFLFKLDRYCGRVDLILWWDCSRRPLASEVYAKAAKMAVDLCDENAVVCPNGWGRPENWADAFRDYLEWIERVRAGRAQPNTTEGRS